MVALLGFSFLLDLKPATQKPVMTDQYDQFTKTTDVKGNTTEVAKIRTYLQDGKL